MMSVALVEALAELATRLAAEMRWSEGTAGRSCLTALFEVEGTRRCAAGYRTGLSKVMPL